MIKDADGKNVKAKPMFAHDIFGESFVAGCESAKGSNYGGDGGGGNNDFDSDDDLPSIKPLADDADRMFAAVMEVEEDMEQSSRADRLGVGDATSTCYYHSDSYDYDLLPPLLTT